MRIGELSRSAGVDADTVRYYEKAGLLPPPRRTSNGYRAYGPEHLERLAFVRHCRALDMPLAEVHRLLAWQEDAPAACEDVNRLLDAQLGRVRERLASLQALERRLTQLRSRCTDGGFAADCGILRELSAAAHGQACACPAPGAGARHCARLQSAGRAGPQGGSAKSPDAQPGKERERH